MTNAINMHADDLAALDDTAEEEDGTTSALDHAAIVQAFRVCSIIIDIIMHLVYNHSDDVCDGTSSRAV